MTLSKSTCQSKGLNIVIPIGSLITIDFQKAGYQVPVSFVKIVARPLLLRSIDTLSVSENDTIWIALPQSLSKQLNIQHLLSK